MECREDAELHVFSISAPVGEQRSLYLPTVAAQFPATVQYVIPSVANMTKAGISNATVNRWRQQYCNIFSIPLYTTYKWKLSIILLRIFQLCEECKSHYMPKILCLYPQLLGIQSGGEIERSNSTEIKQKILLKFCYIIWNWNCIKIYKYKKSGKNCLKSKYKYHLFIYLFVVTYLLVLFAAPRKVYNLKHTDSTQTVISSRITNKLYCSHNKRCYNWLNGTDRILLVHPSVIR